MAEQDQRDGREQGLGDLLRDIEALIRAGDADGVRDLVSGRPAADVAELLESLAEDDGAQVFALLGSEAAGAVLSEVGDVGVKELAQAAPESLAGAVEEMAPDEMADVLDMLSDEQRDSVLQSLPQEDAREVAQLLAHPGDTAGGLMTPDFVLLAQDITAAQAISLLQESRESETIAHLFVCDTADRLLGYLPAHRLVFARPERRISELMTDPVKVFADTDREEVVRLATRYDLAAVPVVGEQERLVGVITVDDILEAAQEEADEDMYRLAGTGERDPVHASVLRSTRLRIPWLALTLLGGIGIAFLVSRFGGALERIRELAFFIPLIPLMGGNVAVQASTIVVRGLAVGDIGGGRVPDFVRKQFIVSVLLALGCGIMAGALGYALPGVEHSVAMAVGVAVAAAITVAGTLGTLLPLASNRLGLDPAVSAGPFVTILNDVFCISIYLALGTLLKG